MNDRKVKGKPHIEAKQWAKIIKTNGNTLVDKIYYNYEFWLGTPQGHSFWSKTLDKIEARGR